MQYYQLLDKLEKVYQRLEGQTLSAPEIVSRLNRAVSMPECKIVSIDTLSIISNDFNISGQYDPNLDRKGRRPIEVEIAFPKRRKYFTLDHEDLTHEHWMRMVYRLADTLGHEMVHLKQHRRRQYRNCRKYVSDDPDLSVKEQQEYFGLNDEIEAYSFNAATAMAYSLPKKPVKLTDVFIYQLYCGLFDNKHPVVVKLRKLSKKCYQKLERQYHGSKTTRTTRRRSI
jgi:hypothetical protein